MFGIPFYIEDGNKIGFYMEDDDFILSARANDRRLKKLIKIMLKDRDELYHVGWSGDPGWFERADIMGEYCTTPKQYRSYMRRIIKSKYADGDLKQRATIQINELRKILQLKKPAKWGKSRWTPVGRSAGGRDARSTERRPRRPRGRS